MRHTGVAAQPFMRDFTRICVAGAKLGWHPANGGNLSYVLTDKEVRTCSPSFTDSGPKIDFDVNVPELAGAYVAVTGAGTRLCDMERSPEINIGIVHIGDAGRSGRVVWGFEGGIRPTSEFSAHLLCHAARAGATGLGDGTGAAGAAGVTGAAGVAGAARAIYHAHCPNLVALSKRIAAGRTSGGAGAVGATGAGTASEAGATEAGVAGAGDAGTASEGCAAGAASGTATASTTGAGSAGAGGADASGTASEGCKDVGAAMTQALQAASPKFAIEVPQGVGVVPELAPGSIELARASAELIGRFSVLVWTGHGLFVMARTVDEAFSLTRTIENAAEAALG